MGFLPIKSIVVFLALEGLPHTAPALICTWPWRDSGMGKQVFLAISPDSAFVKLVKRVSISTADD